MFGWCHSLNLVLISPALFLFGMKKKRMDKEISQIARVLYCKSEAPQSVPNEEGNLVESIDTGCTALSDRVR